MKWKNEEMNENERHEEQRPIWYYITIATRENWNEKKVNVHNKIRWSSDWKEIWDVKIV